MTAATASLLNCINAAGEAIGKMATEAQAWREVAVALMADHAEEGTYLPTDPAVLAYNHARNGRYAEALEVLA